MLTTRMLRTLFVCSLYLSAAVAIAECQTAKRGATLRTPVLVQVNADSTLFVDGKSIATLPGGGSFTVRLARGQHILEIKSSTTSGTWKKVVSISSPDQLVFDVQLSDGGTGSGDSTGTGNQRLSRTPGNLTVDYNRFDDMTTVRLKLVVAAQSSPMEWVFESRFKSQTPKLQPYFDTHFTSASNQGLTLLIDGFRWSSACCDIPVWVTEYMVRSNSIEGRVNTLEFRLTRENVQLLAQFLSAALPAGFNWDESDEPRARRYDLQTTVNYLNRLFTLEPDSRIRYHIEVDRGLITLVEDRGLLPIKRMAYATSLDDFFLGYETVGLSCKEMRNCVAGMIWSRQDQGWNTNPNLKDVGGLWVFGHNPARIQIVNAMAYLVSLARNQ